MTLADTLIVAGASLYAIVVNTEMVGKLHGDSESSIYLEFEPIEPCRG